MKNCKHLFSDFACIIPSVSYLKKRQSPIRDFAFNLCRRLYAAGMGDMIYL